MNQTLVRQWMTTELHTAQPHMRLHDALRLMNKARIRTLPVLREGQLAGIVTKRDLLRADVTTVTRDSWDQYRQVGDMPLERIMSETVITVHPDASVSKAACILMENKITALPVMDEKRQMVGIFTASDIFRMVSEHIKLSTEKVLVSDFMTRELVTITPDTRMLEAQRLMGTKRIRALPVVQSGLLVGIVTRTDLVSAAPSPAASEDRMQIALQILDTPVRFIMTSSPLTVQETDTLDAAADLMFEHKIHSLPVLNNDQSLSGIITESDVFRMVMIKYP